MERSMDGYKKGFETNKKVIMSLSKFSINKPKMAWFLKFNLLIALKLNSNWGQFHEKY